MSPTLELVRPLAAAVEPPASVWDSRPMKPDHRARRLLALAAIVVAIVIAVPRFLTHAPYARLGAKLDWRDGTTGLAHVSDTDLHRIAGLLGHG